MRLILALDNIRSAHNVGSLLRTAWGFNLDSVVTIGLTPHMRQEQDSRLPHVVSRAEREIRKTALGGEILLDRHFESAEAFLDWRQANAMKLICIEKNDDASPLKNYHPHNDSIVVLGNERDGVTRKILRAADTTLAIPIAKHKESYNVSIAGGIAMYALHEQFATLKS